MARGRHQADPRGARHLAAALHEPRRAHACHDRRRPCGARTAATTPARRATASTSTATSTSCGASPRARPRARRAATSSAARPPSASPRPATSSTCSTRTASTASPTCTRTPSSSCGPWGHAPTQTTDPTQAVHDPADRHLRSRSVRRATRSTSPPRDLQRFQTVGARIVDAIKAVRGRIYTNQPGVALYPTTGTQSDYVYSRHIATPSLRKTYGYTFETGPCARRRAESSFHPADPDAGQARRQVGDDRAAAAVHLRDRAHRDASSSAPTRRSPRCARCGTSCSPRPTPGASGSPCSSACRRPCSARCSATRAARGGRGARQAQRRPRQGRRGELTDDGRRPRHPHRACAGKEGRGRRGAPRPHRRWRASWSRSGASGCRVRSSA